MNNQQLFTSKTNEWYTPNEVYEPLNKEFNFNLDPCANAKSAKCAKYFDIETNGLAQDWGGFRVFMNPPYGREIADWVKKAYTESLKPDTIVVALIPARTDTSYWHNYIFGKAEVRFIRGRIKFINEEGQVTNSATFPSAIVIFRGV